MTALQKIATVKSYIAISAIFALLLVFSVAAAPAHAAGTTSGNASLNNLVLLSLFNDDGDNKNLGELVVLSELFGGGVFGGDGQVLVESGDTLSGIAAAFLGDASRYPEIAALNGIANPNLIFPGQVFTLPNGATSNIGELVILSSLFDDDDSSIGDNDNSLEDLILLNLLFGNGNN